MTRNQRPKPQKLSMAEVGALRDAHHAVPDPELTAIGAGQAYVLSDGRVVLVFETGKGILYSSREALLSLVTAVEEMAKTRPEHPAKQLLPQGEKFLAAIDGLVDGLAREIGVHRSELDRTEASLDVLEAGIKRVGAREFLTPALMPMLVAYVGEVMRAATKGRWQMAFDENTSAWEPLVVGEAGQVHQPFALAYTELQRGRAGSIRGAVNGAIRAHLLSRK
jgi:hypothetical protein